MGRRVRFVPEGSLLEVTCRTVQSRLLLRPSANLNRIVLGILGRAQRLYGLRIHACVFMSNHYRHGATRLLVWQTKTLAVRHERRFEHVSR